MAIPNIQPILVSSVENQAQGSDSLFAAFTKVQNNFSTLANLASPYNTFEANSGNPAIPAGIFITTDAPNGRVSFENTGVTGIIAGSNVQVDRSQGVVTISMSGTGNAGVNLVGLRSPNATVNVSNVDSGNIVSTGVFDIDLQTLLDANITSNTYTNPQIRVDQYGRVTNISSLAVIPNTVSNVTVIPGNGITVTPGGNSSSPSFTITNSGVINITPGPGISVTRSGGTFTVSSTLSGGGGGSGVSTVTVRSGSNNISIGSAPNNVTPGNSYSSSSLASFAIDVSPVLSVSTVTANNITANNSVTVVGNLNVSGTVSTISNLTISTALVAGSGSLVVIPTSPPAAANSAGVPGTITYGNGYIYMCIANGNWQRASLASW